MAQCCSKRMFALARDRFPVPFHHSLSPQRPTWQGAYNEAIEELALAEEAWALAPQDVLALCDNPGLLQLDTVWCAAPRAAHWSALHAALAWLFA